MRRSQRIATKSARASDDRDYDVFVSGGTNAPVAEPAVAPVANDDEEKHRRESENLVKVAHYIGARELQSKLNHSEEEVQKLKETNNRLVDKLDAIEIDRALLKRRCEAMDETNKRCRALEERRVELESTLAQMREYIVDMGRNMKIVADSHNLAGVAYLSAYNFYHAVGISLSNSYVCEYTDEADAEIKAFLARKRNESHPDRNMDHQALANDVTSHIGNMMKILCHKDKRRRYNEMLNRYRIVVPAQVTPRGKVVAPEVKVIARYIPHGGVYNTDWGAIDNFMNYKSDRYDCEMMYMRGPGSLPAIIPDTPLYFYN